MFQNLLEPSQTTVQVFQKLTHELRDRYTLNEITDIFEFNKDTNRLLNFFKIFNDKIEQTLPFLSDNSKQSMKIYHRSMFELISFLREIIDRGYKCGRYRQQSSQIYTRNICESCSCNIHYKQISSLKQSLYERSSYLRKYQQPDQPSSGQNQQYLSLTAQDELVKQILEVQKHINQRELRLLKCIQDFDLMKNNMNIQLKKQQFHENFDAFQMKRYIIHVLKHFKGSIQDISSKIESIKNGSKQIKDRSVQVNLQGTNNEQSSKKQNKSSNIKHETQLRKVNEAKAKLQDSIKLYKVEVSQLNLKIQTLQQIKRDLQQQLYFQKLKTFKSKNKLQVQLPSPAVESQEGSSPFNQRKRKSQISLVEDQSIDQFANQDIQNMQRLNRNSQESNIYKNTFKNKGDIMMYKQQSGKGKVDYRNISKRFEQGNQSGEEFKILVNESKGTSKKSLFRHNNSSIDPISRSRIDLNYIDPIMQNVSRNPNKFIISNQLCLNILPTINKTQSNTIHLNIKSETNGKVLPPSFQYKKYKMNTQSNVVEKTLSKFNSTATFSSTKQKFNEEGKIKNDKNQIDKVTKSKNLSSKYRRIKNRTLGNFQQMAENNPDKMLQLDNLLNVKRFGRIDKQVLNKFLMAGKSSKGFICSNDQLLGRGNFQPKPSRNSPNVTVHKSMLDFHEINYVTLFFSLLAKLHLVNQDCYNEVKQHIFDKFTQMGRQLSQLQMKQSLILKKMVTFIIIEHRNCCVSSCNSRVNLSNNNSSGGKQICKHLNNFVLQMQNSMK